MTEDSKAELSLDELRDQLDALWEKYLGLLDTYHRAQQQLARHLSSGFFDLAQATFKSTTRVRYGQDYYDDRMQATRRFDAHLDSAQVPRIELKSEASHSSTKHDKESAESNVHETIQQQPTPASTPPPDSEEKQQQEQIRQEEQHSDKASDAKKFRDPLHWYGILVPPPLRSSQKSFISAVQGPVIEAANSAQALRQVTLEIRKLRKDIKKAEKRSA